MPTEHDNANALHLISDILDKLIDTQQSTSEANIGLKSSVDDAVEVLENIRGHFTNGFRSELKGHIEQSANNSTVAIKDHVDVNSAKITTMISDHRRDEWEPMLKKSTEQLRDISSNLEKLINTLSKPWFWIKMIGTTIAALAVIIAAVAKLISSIGG